MTNSFGHKRSAIQSKTDLRMLASRIQSYGVPTTWKTNVAEFSIMVMSPNRSKSVKIDTSKAVYIDRMKAGQVKSEKHVFKTLDEAWLKAEQILNSFLKRG